MKCETYFIEPSMDHVHKGHKLFCIVMPRTLWDFLGKLFFTFLLFLIMCRNTEFIKHENVFGIMLKALKRYD